MITWGGGKIGLLSLLALIVLASCTRTPFSLLGVHTSVNVISHVDAQGSVTQHYESLAIFIESEDDALLQMEVTSPDGANLWVFPLEKRRVNNTVYYGKTGLALGPAISLPQGVWHMRLLNQDGRTLTEEFTLDAKPSKRTSLPKLSSKEGLLTLQEEQGEVLLSLLDEEKKELQRSSTTEQKIDLTSLYPQWNRVRYVGLSWYDESSKSSHIVWYTL